MRILKPLSITALCPLAVACGGDGTGTINVTTYGEDFIEVGIPASPPAEDGIVDGYDFKYNKFLIALSDIRIAGGDDQLGAVLDAQQIWDMTQSGPHAITSFTEVEATDWPRVGATIEQARGATAGNATAEDVTRMNDGAYSLYVEGTATSTGGEVFTFSWGFQNGTRYDDCADADERAGVLVPDGGSVTIDLTIHGDHLIFDDLQSEDPSLRFKAIAAADTDADKDVTLDELEAVDLTTLPADQYGTGGDGTVVNLRQFVAAQMSTLLHFQGEGHCQPSRL